MEGTDFLTIVWGCAETLPVSDLRFCFFQQVYVFQLGHWHTWHTPHALTCVGKLWRSRHNTINAILIQWHVNEWPGILKLLPGLPTNVSDSDQGGRAFWSLVCICKYFERFHHKAPGNRKPKAQHLHRQNNNLRTNTKLLTKEFYKQKSRGSSCDLALSVHDNVNHHQDNTRDQHANAFILIGSQLVVMVLRAQLVLGTIAQFFHFVAEEKKRR